MGKDAVSYSNVSTCVAISTKPGYLYGYSIVPLTTAAVTINIFDASASNSGTLVVGDYSSAAAGRKAVTFANPVACRTGIYLNVTCTSAADNVVVFFAVA